MLDYLKTFLVVAFVAGGLTYASGEAFFTAKAQGQPIDSCCMYTQDCNPGMRCESRSGRTCSIYRKPNYCAPSKKTGGVFIPGGGAN